MRGTIELERVLMQGRYRRFGLAAIAAGALALMSALVERTGPELVGYGNLCGPTASDPCYQPALKGGFPFPFLYDAPGISVERQLSFGEDDLHIGGLVLDVVIYFGMCMVIVARFERASRRTSRRD